VKQFLNLESEWDLAGFSDKPDRMLLEIVTLNIIELLQNGKGIINDLIRDHKMNDEQWDEGYK